MGASDLDEARRKAGARETPRKRGRKKKLLIRGFARFECTNSAKHIFD